MKKLIIALFFLLAVFSVSAQTYLERYESLVSDKAFNIRVEVALKELSLDIIGTVSDSIYMEEAVSILLASNNKARVMRYVQYAAAANINPAISDGTLKSGIRLVFIRFYNLRRFQQGIITKEEFYDL